MQIYKADSGRYYIRKMIAGKQQYIYFDKKPTKTEIENKIYELKSQEAPGLNGTFKVCAEAYIAAKESVLSVSTVRGYNSIMRALSDRFLALKLAHITQIDVQTEISSYALNHSPKTVNNVHGFISAVLAFYRPNFKLNTTLPQKEKRVLHIPTDEEVQRIIEAVKGKDIEIIVLLAICGLRRSEAMAITSADLDGNYLTINKALVQDKNENFVIKSTKTTASTRTIWIPDYLANLINEKGVAYDKIAGNVLVRLHTIQDNLGIERFRLHDLRHYYVSFCHAQGISTASIAETVGHSSTLTTRNVYMHSQKDKQEDNQREIAAKLFYN